MKNRVEPYKNWTKQDFRDAVTNEVIVLDIDIVLKQLWLQLINEGLESKFWNVTEDYNGCTIVQDMKHPDPACFVHDYMWICGYGGKMSDKIFKTCMILGGMTKAKAFRRWFSVRTGWMFGYYWKYKTKGTLKEPTDAMIKFYNYIK